MTLIEVLLVVAMLGLLVAPITGWVLVSMKGDASTRTRNVDSASIGLLRSYFVRDVASAKAALAGSAANGADCPGGEGAAGAEPARTMLRLKASTSDVVVYNLIPGADGKTASIYRRECRAGVLEGSSEIATRIDPDDGLVVTCSARPDAPSGDCGKVRLQATTVDSFVTSMTATMRTGTAAAAVAGGPTYMSPEVVLAANPTTVFRGEAVSLDAAGTVDPQGKALTFNWDFGDGSPTAGTEATSHEYSQLGQFTVVLTVTNSDGTPASDYVRVEVRNRLPTAVIAAPAAPVSTNMCTGLGFDGTGSNDDGDAAYGGTVASYQWSYGDGTSATLPNASHAYQYKEPSGDEPFTAGLEVVDNDEGTSTSVSQQVTVTNRNPTASITANGSAGTLVMTTGVPVNFASVVTDPDSACDGGGFTYEWEFGDGTSSTSPSPTHTYSSKPLGKVKLTVTDRWGATATSNQITVTGNGPPVALFTVSPNPVRAGVDVSITDGSSDPDGDGLTYAWTFPGVGPGYPGTSNSATPGPLKFTHNVGSADTFLSATYNLGLTVTDAGLATRSATVPITVTGAPTPTGLSATGACTKRNFWGTCTKSWNTVSWDAVASVSSYQLEVRWESCGWFSCSTTNRSYNQSTNSITFNNYERSGAVELRVRALDSYTSKYGQWTGWVGETFAG